MNKRAIADFYIKVSRRWTASTLHSLAKSLAKLSGIFFKETYVVSTSGFPAIVVPAEANYYVANLRAENLFRFDYFIKGNAMQPTQPFVPFKVPQIPKADNPNVDAPDLQQPYFLDLNKFYEEKVKPLEQKAVEKLTLHESRILTFYDTARQVVKNGDPIKTQAELNHQRWGTNAPQRAPSDKPRIQVVAGDWGDVTSWLTKQAGGKRVVVLNMANAKHPGGGYFAGAAAQEENMFRRTDVFTAVRKDELENSSVTDFDKILYNKKTTDLINCQGQYTCLDTDHPIVCFKASEACGYKMLDEQEYFSFYELRAALPHLNPPYARRSPEEQAEIRVDVKKRIQVALNTLAYHGVRDAVLSAWGCGAFGHSAEVVAELFDEVLQEHSKDFDNVVFAIFIDEEKSDDPNMKHYMDLSKHNLSAFHARFHPNDVNVLHIGPNGIPKGEKLIEPKVTRTEFSVCLEFDCLAAALHVVDKLGLEPMWDKTMQRHLPLVDNVSSPGKFKLRIPITKKDQGNWIPFYEPMRAAHPEFTFLPKLEDIPAHARIDQQAIVHVQEKNQKIRLVEQMTQMINEGHFPKHKLIELNIHAVKKTWPFSTEYHLEVVFKGTDQTLVSDYVAFLNKNGYEVSITGGSEQSIWFTKPAAVTKLLKNCGAYKLFKEFITQ